MIDLILLIALTLGQTGFDTARVHQHVVSSTYEGVWVKRIYADSSTSWPLGNQLAVRGATNELWFYYAFDPQRDGPMIATAESTPSGMRVRVTYDPVCFYVTKLELLGAVTPVIPRPTPSPSPMRESATFKWPSKDADRRILWIEKSGAGWLCVPYDGVLYCSR